MSMNKTVLITEKIDKAGTEYLARRGYEIRTGSGIDERTVMREISGCDAVLTRNAVITEKIMRASSKLKVISVHGVGVDKIDVDAATRLGIQVTNAAGSNKLSVAEYTIGLIVGLAKNIPQYDRELRSGNWGVRNTLLGLDLEGKTLGIVGMGNIGTLVAKKAAAGLGMKVTGFKRHKTESNIENVEITDNLEKVIKTADFLSLHIPSSKATRRFIGKRELSLMKPGAYFINTARGDVVDEKALCAALEEKRIAGAAIDVFTGEIPSMDNPLLHMRNVIVTPHAAAFTVESTARMALYAAVGVDEVLSGKNPENPVNKVEIPADMLTAYTCLNAVNQ